MDLIVRVNSTRAVPFNGLLPGDLFAMRESLGVYVKLADGIGRRIDHATRVGLLVGNFPDVILRGTMVYEAKIVHAVRPLSPTPWRSRLAAALRRAGQRLRDWAAIVGAAFVAGLRAATSGSAILDDVVHDWMCDACFKWNPDRRTEEPCQHCGKPRPDINSYRKHKGA